MNVAFRPALPQEFDDCERLYSAEMERINRELKLETLPSRGAASAPKSCIASSARQREKIEAPRNGQAMTPEVVKTNPPNRLSTRLGSVDRVTATLTPP